MRANSVRIHAQKLSTNFSKDSCRILTRFRCAQIQYRFVRKNCPRISVRIDVEFWLGLDAPKFICRKPKWKIRLNISHRTCSIRDPTIFELSELNWRACQLTCSLNIHHKHIRHYHLLSIASFLSTRFIKDLHQTLTSVRYPHRLKGTHLHTYTYLHTPFSTYTHPTSNYIYHTKR